jgi:hypothetical protein
MKNYTRGDALVKAVTAAADQAAALRALALPAKLAATIPVHTVPGINRATLRGIPTATAQVQALVNRNALEDPSKAALLAKGMRGDRAFYTDGVVHLRKDMRVERIGHEIAHHIVAHIPGAGQKCEAFIDMRAPNEVPQSLKKLFPKWKFKASEYAKKDRFDLFFNVSNGYDERHAWYCGKLYPLDAPLSALGRPYRPTELISMGVEAILKDAVGFAKADPEFFKFTVGILDGSL